MRGRFRRQVSRCAALGILACTTAAGAAAHDLLEVAIDRPVSEVSGEDPVYLKISLTGAAPRPGGRAAANVAIVLDRSGSMKGEKLVGAKRAAAMAVSRLREGDAVSLVAYDDNVQVLVPATQDAEPELLRAAMESMTAGGSTALFAGVSKAAAEVRNFLDPLRVNRIVLLSDGLANVGPSAPAELAELGSSLKKEGISVSTVGLGLGYNEDLMSRLADRSDGNHSFAENPRDLARIFDVEFGDLLSVTATDVIVRIACGHGVRPVRVLGRQAWIIGGSVEVRLNQLSGGFEKYVLLELDVPPGRPGASIPLAAVTVDYRNAVDGDTASSRREMELGYSADPAAVERQINRDVVVAVVEQTAVERNQVAIALRDQGDVKRAEAMLLANVGYVDEFARRLDSERLRQLAIVNRKDAQQLDDERWGATRKRMRATQQVIRQQQVAPERAPE